MLVLARKQGESIRIMAPGIEPVTIKIVRLKGASVRVGIDAPQGVKVLRSEIVSDELATTGRERAAMGIGMKSAAGQ